MEPKPGCESSVQIRRSWWAKKNLVAKKNCQSKGVMASWLKIFNWLIPPKNRPIAKHHQCCDPLAFKVPPNFWSDPNAGKKKSSYPPLGQFFFKVDNQSAALGLAAQEMDLVK